ncbi:hypothetical protein ACFSVK_09635 [Azorhizophilus paspali]|uniref:hypothetical protein n=1 Tax=Azorhizophilus paspali TaxID=69963 RepID=UPI0036357DC4
MIVQLNLGCNPLLEGLHDIHVPADRRPIPLVRDDDRIGTPAIEIDPAKFAAIVICDTPERRPTRPDAAAGQRNLGQAHEGAGRSFATSPRVGEERGDGKGRGEVLVLP